MRVLEGGGRVGLGMPEPRRGPPDGRRAAAAGVAARSPPAGPTGDRATWCRTPAAVPAVSRAALSRQRRRVPATSSIRTPALCPAGTGTAA